MFSESDELFASVQFHLAQSVFVEVVLVDTGDVERCVRVPLPSAAEIEFVVDAVDVPGAGDGQSECIVFSVACVGEANAAQDVGAEGSWCSQPVDAECVVASVFGSPFFVVDESGRKSLKMEVHHAIASNHHRCRCCAGEGVADALQHVRCGVEVIGVKLHGIFSAVFRTNCHVPASSDAQICSFGSDDHEAVADVGTLFHFCQCLRRAIVGVVVHHDDVEVKVCLLRKRTLHGVLNRSHTVSDGNDDRNLHGIVLLVVGWKVFPVLRGEIGINLFQVFGAGTLHFELHGTCGGVHVVKLFFARCSVVGLDFGVEDFRQVEDDAFAGEEEAEGIPSGVAETRGGSGVQKLSERLRANEHKTSEVKVVAQTSRGVVNARVSSVAVVSVAIDHFCSGGFRSLQHSFPASVGRDDFVGAEREEKIG